VFRVQKVEKFAFGVDALDRLFPSALKAPSLIVVAGHPGAGKTTLASHICYSNALKGSKCLYISFQEDREKLFGNMKAVGVDLATAESRGYLNFLRLPMVLSVDSLVDEISKVLASFRPRVVVVDSVNVVLASAGDDVKRAWLQNYFYEVAREVGGVVVLVSELPFGEEKLGLGSIEFVADAILILKHRIEDGKLVRTMEIRKIRGAPISLAEVPFAISPEHGLKVYLPPILEEIPAEGEPMKNPCRLLDKAFGHVRRGHVMFISYSVRARPPEVFMVPIGYALANKARIMLISFRASPKTLFTTIAESFASLGLSRSVAEDFLSRYAVFKSFNPFAISSSELTSQLIEAVNSVNPEIVLLHAFDIFAIAHRPHHFRAVYNIINYLKNKNILTVILSIRSNSGIVLSFVRLSDVVIDFKFRLRDGKLVKYAHLWRRERNPYIASEEEIASCRDDMSSLLLS